MVSILPSPPLLSFHQMWYFSSFQTDLQKPWEETLVHVESPAEEKSPLPPPAEVNYEVKARVEKWEQVARQKMADHESTKSGGGLRGGSQSDVRSANTTLVKEELELKVSAVGLVELMWIMCVLSLLPFSCETSSERSRIPLSR